MAARLSAPCLHRNRTRRLDRRTRNPEHGNLEDWIKATSVQGDPSGRQWSLPVLEDGTYPPFSLQAVEADRSRMFWNSSLQWAQGMWRSTLNSGAGLTLPSGMEFVAAR